MNQTILIRPLLTEKSNGLTEARHYSFVVASGANKIEIRKAIEARYPNIPIDAVRTMIVRAKNKRTMTRKGVVAGRKGGYKKAIVTLTKTSDLIEFYENV